MINDANQSRSGLRALRCSNIVWAALLSLGTGGCLEISQAINGGSSGGSDNVTSEAEDRAPDSGGDSAIVVQLMASNSTPGLGEEVALACRIVSGEAENAIFDFQPRSSRLIVNERQGTATFIVTESELGTQLSFTCTAEVQNETSEPSNRLNLFPGP